MKPSDKHDILMITYNRPDYTRMSLGALLDSCDEKMRVWVWHNGTDAATLNVVKSFSEHPNFHHLEYCPENKKLREPTNWFWQNSDGQYLTKVDDDCLLPKGWGEELRSLHESSPKLGVIGCWRFYDEDYFPSAALRKTVDLPGGAKLMRNCWVQGSGYVMKRACFEQNGPLGPDESFAAYCIRLASKGWENGWPFPFIHEEHMDDPRSPFCEIKTDEDFLSNRPLTAVRCGILTLEDWGKRMQFSAKIVQEASPDYRDYRGLRKAIRMLGSKIKKIAKPPEAPWQKL